MKKEKSKDIINEMFEALQELESKCKELVNEYNKLNPLPKKEVKATAKKTATKTVSKTVAKTTAKAPAKTVAKKSVATAPAKKTTKK